MTECPDLVALEAEVLPPPVAAHVQACDSRRLVVELRGSASASGDCEDDCGHSSRAIQSQA